MIIISESSDSTIRTQLTLYERSWGDRGNNNIKKKFIFSSTLKGKFIYYTISKDLRSTDGQDLEVMEGFSKYLSNILGAIL